MISELPSDTFLQLQTLTVTRVVADPADRKLAAASIDEVFQGSGDPSYEHCYVSNPSNGSSAFLDIQPASVFQLQFLNRRGCFAEAPCYNK